MTRHIDGYLRHRESRMIGLILIGLVAGILIALLCASAWAATHKPKKIEPTTQYPPLPGQWLIPPDDGYIKVPLKEFGKDVNGPAGSAWESALTSAIRGWKNALPPSYSFPKRPHLYKAPVGNIRCPNTALACADLEANEIVVMTDCPDGHEQDCDKLSIMLHEYAHLLGVPHITGDPLMESMYTRPWRSPTEFAVALALAAKRQQALLERYGLLLE